MKPLKTVLDAMNSSVSLSPEEIAVALPYSADDVKRYLDMLEQAGLVESIQSGRYKRDKKWKSKQKDLFRS